MSLARLSGVYMMCLFGSIEVVNAHTFPAKLSIDSLTYSINEFVIVTNNAKRVQLISDITADDNLWISYLLTTKSWDFIPIDGEDYDDDFRDIIAKADNVILCDPIFHEEHHQFFQILDTAMGLSILKGCPIQAMSLNLSERFFMNLDYYDWYITPSCGDYDNLSIDLYSWKYEEPIFTVGLWICDSRISNECIYD